MEAEEKSMLDSFLSRFERGNSQDVAMDSNGVAFSTGSKVYHSPTRRRGVVQSSTEKSLTVAWANGTVEVVNPRSVSLDQRPVQADNRVFSTVMDLSSHLRESQPIVESQTERLYFWIRSQDRRIMGPFLQEDLRFLPQATGRIFPYDKMLPSEVGSLSERAKDVDRLKAARAFAKNAGKKPGTDEYDDIVGKFLGNVKEDSPIKEGTIILEPDGRYSIKLGSEGFRGDRNAAIKRLIQYGALASMAESLVDHCYSYCKHINRYPIEFTL